MDGIVPQMRSEHWRAYGSSNFKNYVSFGMIPSDKATIMLLLDNVDLATGKFFFNDSQTGTKQAYTFDLNWVRKHTRFNDEGEKPEGNRDMDNRIWTTYFSNKQQSQYKSGRGYLEALLEKLVRSKKKSDVSDFVMLQILYQLTMIWTPTARMNAPRHMFKYVARVDAVDHFPWATIIYKELWDSFKAVKKATKGLTYLSGCAPLLSMHASDIADFIRKEVNLPPVLIGHSFGGLIVQSYLSNRYSSHRSSSSVSDNLHPLLAGAVLVCSVPPSGNSGLVWRYLLTKPVVAIKVTLSLAAKAFANSLSLCKETFFSSKMDDRLVQRYQELMRESSKLPLFDLKMLNASLPVASIPKNSVEVLVIGASNDFIVDKEGLHETAKFFDVQEVSIQGVAHDIMLDSSWEKGAETILSWLKSSSLSPVESPKKPLSPVQAVSVGEQRKGEKKRKAEAVSETNSLQYSSVVAPSETKKKNRGRRNSKEEEKPKEVVHVRARRGQATDSHSLAERVRREKINERMRCLQDLVPGCYKTMGMAGTLDEIINYVQSLQNQVEFLSMKLTAASSFYDFNSDIEATATTQPVLPRVSDAYQAQEMERVMRGGYGGCPSFQSTMPF
ncbi:uncharacterized protein A4U43_C01F29440 [Asparagus officinalis]|uniref:BHLH domain-containing protein n=2 Tax=Magnoliopsida TaxID=3398 RepID=A0A5P1FVH0_ASPOF|nr:uncharacterized protein A4U43_C01F29440 [Asparagus officinalis]